ncbi:MAG: hypothetical protein ACRD6X_22385 [Pyrinomonadaceae bacterium]
MAKNIILLDNRIEGTMTVSDLLKTFMVDKDTSLMSAFGFINTMAKGHGTIETLFILCHGYEAIGPDAKVGQFYWWVGGRGLQLGKEDVREYNLNLWSSIKGSVKNIVIMACGAAATQSGDEGRKDRDGKFLLTSLAKVTNAVVYGADTTQWYQLKRMDFGKWEGTLYCFLPTGQYFAVPGQIANGLAVRQ